MLMSICWLKEKTIAGGREKQKKKKKSALENGGIPVPAMGARKWLVMSHSNYGIPVSLTVISNSACVRGKAMHTKGRLWFLIA